MSFMSFSLQHSPPGLYHLSTLSYKLTFFLPRESILFDEDLSRSDFRENSCVFVSN